MGRLPADPRYCAVMEHAVSRRQGGQPLAVLRTAKLHNLAAVASACAHQQRTKETPNADPAGEIRLLAGTADAVEGVQRRLATLHRPARSNSVIAVEVLMTASEDYFRPDSASYGDHDQKRTDTWATHSMKWLRQEWGGDNIASATLHLDESTPHLHAIVVPVDPNTGRLNARRWLNGRKLMSAMQDRYADAVVDLGIHRGVRQSKATHVEVSQFYGDITSEVDAVPRATITPPPALLLTAAQRAKWAQEEAARVRAEQEAAIRVLENKARAYDTAAKRRDELQSTLLANQEAEGKREAARASERTAGEQEAQVLRSQLAEQRAIADRLRPVPLDQVAELFPSGHLARRGLRIAQLKDGKPVIAALNEKKILGRNSIDLIMLAADTDYAGALSFIKSRAPDELRPRFGPDLGQFLLAHQQTQTGLPDHLRQRFARVLAAVAPGKFPEVLRTSREVGFEWLPDGTMAPFIGDVWLNGKIQLTDDMKPRLAPVADDLQHHVIDVYHRMQQQRRGPRR